MLSPSEVADVVTEMVTARLAGENPRLAEIINNLITGPRADALNVTLMFAGIVALDLGDDPVDGFHRIEAQHVDEHGVAHDVSVGDVLPGYAATFLQMVVALANNERTMARDLYLGHVGADWQKASRMLVFALSQTLHQNGLCCAVELESEAGA